MKQEKIWNKSYITLFLINLIVSTSFYMISTALSKHLVHLGMTVTMAGSVIGSMSFASMLTRPVTGWVSDHLDRKILLSLSLAVNFLCVVGYGVCTNAMLYIVLRIFHGIAFGMVTTVTMVLVSGCIPIGRMGEGMGYFGLAQTMAVAIGPSISLALYERVGSRNMFFASAGCIAVAFVGAMLMDTKTKAAGDRSENSKEIFTFRLQDFVAKEAIIFAVITIAISSINGIENGYIVLYAEQFGISNVGWYFTISAFTLFFSRAVCSRLPDHIGFTKTLCLGLGSIIFALLILSLAPVGHFTGALTAGSILKALGVGTLQPALQAATVQSVPPERRGAATSTFYIGTDLGQFSAPIIAGSLIDSVGYVSMFRIYILPLFGVGVLYILLKTKKKNK